MRQPILIHVAGLGLVVAGTDHKGQPEMRWSTDPEAGIDAPACLFSDPVEIRHFLRTGISAAFISENSLNPIRVDAPAGATTLDKAEAIAQGVPAELWNEVRVGLSIFGRGPDGPTCENFTWSGDREEYDAGMHMRQAFELALSKDMRSPTISTHVEAGPSLLAGNFMTSYQQTVKPELHMAQQALDSAVEELLRVEADSIHSERARSIIRSMQTAVLNLDEHTNRMRESLNLPPLKQRQATSPSAPQTSEQSATAPTATPAPEAELFTRSAPSLG